MACVAGGLVFALCYRLDIDRALIDLIAAFTVILIRFIAVRYKVQLPVVKQGDIKINTKIFKQKNKEE